MFAFRQILGMLAMCTSEIFVESEKHKYTHKYSSIQISSFCETSQSMASLWIAVFEGGSGPTACKLLFEQYDAKNQFRTCDSSRFVGLFGGVLCIWSGHSEIKRDKLLLFPHRFINLHHGNCDSKLGPVSWNISNEENQLIGSPSPWFYQNSRSTLAQNAVFGAVRILEHGFKVKFYYWLGIFKLKSSALHARFGVSIYAVPLLVRPFARKCVPHFAFHLFPCRMTRCASWDRI